jgi:hypothetical protein
MNDSGKAVARFAACVLVFVVSLPLLMFIGRVIFLGFHAATGHPLPVSPDGIPVVALVLACFISERVWRDFLR